MKNVRLSPLLGISVLLAMAACEPLDNKAATRNPGWDGQLTENIEPADREVFVNIDETEKVATGCDKTVIDAHNILKNHCASCHDIGMASFGVPRFDFVMDDAQLMTKTWDRTGQPAARFLTPGDPANSVIYLRSTMNRDMPPTMVDPNQPFYPRVTFSEGSVLFEWIANCISAPTATPATTTAATP